MLLVLVTNEPFLYHIVVTLTVVLVVSSSLTMQMSLTDDPTIRSSELPRDVVILIDIPGGETVQ